MLTAEALTTPPHLVLAALRDEEYVELIGEPGYVRQRLTSWTCRLTWTATGRWSRRPKYLLFLTDDGRSLGGKEIMFFNELGPGDSINIDYRADVQGVDVDEFQQRMKRSLEPPKPVEMKPTRDPLRAGRVIDLEDP